MLNRQDSLLVDPVFISARRIKGHIICFVSKQAKIAFHPPRMGILEKAPSSFGESEYY